LIRLALATRQPLSEVQEWDDATIMTVLNILDEQADAMKDAAKGRG